LKDHGVRQEVQRLVSAGGVVYKVVDDRVCAVLCGRRSPLQWSLPKGTPDSGETLEETALREVREETGLEVTIEAPIGDINYWFVSPQDKSLCNKTVHFFLMAHSGGSTDQHDFEFDEVQWFPSEKAVKTLAYANEARVLERALAMIRERTSS
jgi:8-oxo-dGTP pyrophosphatase MutT (NUDIX family)